MAALLPRAPVRLLQGERQLGPRIILSQNHLLLLFDALLLVLAHPLPFLVHLPLFLDYRQPLLGLQANTQNKSSVNLCDHWARNILTHQFLLGLLDLPIVLGQNRFQFLALLPFLLLQSGNGKGILAPG